jgi:processive 1,2-diacylglycerol beta-glucosyltransferase
VHRQWVQKNISRYFVASEQAKQNLIDFGVDKDKVSVTGIPIKPGFAKDSGLSKADLRKKLGLDPDKPTVLMIGGSLGMGNFEGVARAFNESGKDYQLVMILGKNELKKDRLDLYAKGANIPTKVLGFEKNTGQWMEASDVVISKPGGLTTSEIFSKKVPMLILDPSPGFEEMLIPSVEATGAALRAKDPQDAVAVIDDFLKNPAQEEKVKKSLERVGKPDAALDIARQVMGDIARPGH